MPIPREVAKTLTGEWQVGLCEAPCQAPLSFAYGCTCMCCMAAQQRGEILDLIGEPYVCCGGLMPCCGPCRRPQDRSCIWVEACCCVGLAVAANRFLMQTRFDLRNTACDDCLLWATCITSCVMCLMSCAGNEVPDGMENGVECLKTAVGGCMLAQQQVEIRHIRRAGYRGVKPSVRAALAPLQHEMISQGKTYDGEETDSETASLPVRGFMASGAPNGMQWAHYCQVNPTVDPTSGYVVGPWGECLAWAKVFQFQHPDWAHDHQFLPEGPCGQVITAMLDSCPGQTRHAVHQAAERLEQACELAAERGMPLPVINTPVH